ncbi:PqiC family protein [Ramlibacter sp. XY19]|uniref:ABC-type transport auxiliary lipoprotein family protein n=1 Tax=Ramlibacter paludis TaxID=2908000 RepID=UPI0023DCDE01|nr:ABC-type transport auxiliary lipoprotein family protein [Ramlibacter paludis]MCG2595555.1 PqiC family protein [Ramlibacter paludis]
MIRRSFSLAAIALLAGCSILPDKPVREFSYDLGPQPVADAPGSPAGAPLVLPDVEVQGALESTAFLYRLGYADAFQLRPYAYAKWSAPPAQLIRQRLRDHLGRERPILDSAAAASLARRGGVTPPVLRVELEEFSQVFESQAASQGVLRLRCTLLENSAAGERLVAQRTFTVQRPAPTADAPGGVRALSAATDAAAGEIATWLRQPR